jgi:hypothetical protein
VAREQEQTRRARNKADIAKLADGKIDRMDPAASSSGSGEIKT